MNHLYVLAKKSADGGTCWWNGRDWTTERPDAMEFDTIRAAQAEANAGMTRGRIAKGKFTIDHEATE